VTTTTKPYRRVVLSIATLSALLATGTLTGCAAQPKTAKEIQEMEDEDRAARAAVQQEMQALYDEATALVADT